MRAARAIRRTRDLAGCALAASIASACAFSPYEARHEVLWDSRSQIWLSEAQQLKLRAAQSRTFEDADRTRTLEAIVSAMQDLDFQVDVLDEALGVVSGKKFIEHQYVSPAVDPTYLLYTDETLLLFSRSYRTWGPFFHRDNLVRLTVTLRPRGPSQLLVRASAQFYMRAVEEPEPYQKFFRTLEQALFADRELVQ